MNDFCNMKEGLRMNCFFPEEHILQLEISEIQTANLVCTNEKLKELVIGYLLNYGLIQKLDDLQKLDISASGEYAFAVVEKCGSDVRETVHAKEALKWMPIEQVYRLSEIRDCAEIMNKCANKHKETGGVHCSALFSNQEVISLFEDLGRHNTIDKIAGDMILRSIEVKDTLLVTTGRISSDMVLKANKMGVSVIASYSTPTSRAIVMAEKANMTLISYLGRDKRAVCTAPFRVVS